MDKAPSHHCAHHPSAAYILRIAVGGLLLFMSINKFNAGVGPFVDNMSAMFTGSLLPMGFVKMFLTVVPFAEGALGVLLILGLWTKIAAWVAGFLFALFAVGLTSTGNPDLGSGIAFNFIYLFAAIFLGKMGHTKLSLDHLLCGNKCDM